jgi:protein-tyrosine phosphatase
MRFDADINTWQLGPGLWRSASPDALDADGWTQVAQAGIRRIVDLRNAYEIGTADHRPDGFEIVCAPIEDPDDPAYTTTWNWNWAHPDFFVWGIGHWPELWHAAFEAIADAPEGAVLIHCAAGRDRTGMMSAIMLELAGNDRATILEDYARAMRGTNEMLRRQGRNEHEAHMPEDLLEGYIRDYAVAVNVLLDRLPALLEDNGLSSVARRAATRVAGTTSSPPAGR